MAQTNATILDQIWLNGSNDYQQRVPKASKAGIENTMSALFSPLNNDLWNQFVSGLINRIGLTLVKQLSWRNPLAQFKIGTLGYGKTIQEVANKLIKAQGYTDDAQTLFKVNRPESAAAYHTINRQDKYGISINEAELRQAFTDEFGLNNYIASVLDIPATSDNIDEYNIMLESFANYQRELGFYNINVEEPTDEASAKAFVRAIRTAVGKLKFPRFGTLTNAAGYPTTSQVSDLLLITTPEIAAAVDVEVKTGAYNVEFVELLARTVIVDEMPVPETYGFLVNKDWFKAADALLETRAFYNPETLTTNYYLHHWGVYSASPFESAIRFSEDPDTDIETVTVTQGSDFELLVNDELTDRVSTGRSKLSGRITDGDVDPANPNVVSDDLTYRFALVDPTKGVKLSPTGILNVASNVELGTTFDVEVTITHKDDDTINDETVTLTVA